MKKTLLFLVLAVLIVVAFLSNLFFGAVSIPFGEVADILTGGGEPDSPLTFIILESRMPQSVTASLAGAGLAVAGLLLQTAFRNPLAGPTVLGVSSGASLGVAVVMLIMGGTLTLGSITWSGFAAVLTGALIGSLGIMGILILLSSVVRNDLMLLITGIMIGYLTSSVVTLLSSLTTAQGLQGYVMWGMGTFGDVTRGQLPWFAAMVGFGLMLSLLLAKPLNLLLLGERYARNLGVNVRVVRNLLLVATGVLTAVVTAWCGPISFIGIAVPHISRFMFRTDNHWVLLPSTMLSGGIMALLCNVLSTVPENTVIPINALTPVIGVPVILYVILRMRKGR